MCYFKKVREDGVFVFSNDHECYCLKVMRRILATEDVRVKSFVVLSPSACCCTVLHVFFG